MNGYIAARQSLKMSGNPDKSLTRHRRAFAGTVLFETASNTRNFMAALLATAATGCLEAPTEAETVARFRARMDAIRQRLLARVPAGLVRDVLSSVYDVSLHSDRQILQTVKALREADELTLSFGDLAPLWDFVIDLVRDHPPPERRG